MTDIRLEPQRGSLLTPFGLATLQDRYLLPGEDPQDLFARVAKTYADDDAHAQRLYDYMSKLWFMPATPVLSNGGSNRGLPISCFLNTVPDSLSGITETWVENIWLAARGGGIGTYYGDVRSIGEPVGEVGETSGIIPFIKVTDSLTLAISQGSLRRGSAAVYIDIFHPEIEEFLEIRKASGDANRRSLNLHHGICIPDEFMDAVRHGEQYPLISPRDGHIVKYVSARGLWQKILEIRIATGEPYLLFTDTVNNAAPDAYLMNNLKVRQSNLCAEIMLATDDERTAVCCLSSVNAEMYYQWSGCDDFIPDVMAFLDNVLQDFIDRAPPEMHRAVYSAIKERSVGLGVMGFHSFLQSHHIPFGSALAKAWNFRIFRELRKKTDEASETLGLIKGPAPDTMITNKPERFTHKMAIAPTASISIIAGGTSAGIEPIPSNIYTHKTLSGSFSVKNPYLEKRVWTTAAKLFDHDEAIFDWVDAQWISILEHEGSVQQLSWMDDHDKEVFQTAFEIDQRWIVELAGDRAPLIDQGQSVNLFLPANIHKEDLHGLHWMAWERGVKSLYYCRSKSLQRAGFANGTRVDSTIMAEPKNYDECLACQ